MAQAATSRLLSGRPAELAEQFGALLWGNLMINVQPKNSKLLDRSRRIVAAATGVSYTDAEQMLAAAGNNVREAITRWEEKARNG